MRFNPMTDEEINALELPSFLLPEGLVDFEVRAVKEKHFNSGSSGYEMELMASANGKTGLIKARLIFHPNSMWYVKAFCKSIGKPNLLKKGIIHAHDILGTKGIAKNKHRKYVGNDGNEKATNDISGWVFGEEAKHLKLVKEEQNKFVDDDLPF